MARQVPNITFRELLAETGWTGDALARAINKAGAEVGMPLRYGRSSVSHWLAGMCPRPPVPELVAEVFSRKLHRPVLVSETGLGRRGQPDPPRAAWWEADVVSRLVEPREVGAGGSVPLSSRSYRLIDLTVPSWGELAGTRPGWACLVESDGRSERAEKVAKVERWQVRSAAGLVELFSDTDFAFGGGHARLELARYLAASVAPWLWATATPTVRRDLLVTASRLTYLCGFMFFDDELHGAAQHYYLTNLRLAAESGDRTGYAVTLRALSGQARFLGHHREAVCLAEAAVRAAGSSAGAQTAAFLFGQLAVAYAADGNQWKAVRYLLIAERHLDRARDEPGPVGGCHMASLAHQQAAVRAKLGDRSGAIQALTVSVRHRPVSERRSRAITLAWLAELQLESGDLEAACGTWQRFLLDYPYLQSRRVSRAFAGMRAHLRSHQKSSAVIALRRRAAMLPGTRL